MLNSAATTHTTRQDDTTRHDTTRHDTTRQQMTATATADDKQRPQLRPRPQYILLRTAGNGRADGPLDHGGRRPVSCQQRYDEILRRLSSNGDRCWRRSRVRCCMSALPCPAPWPPVRGAHLVCIASPAAAAAARPPCHAMPCHSPLPVRPVQCCPRRR